MHLKDIPKLLDRFNIGIGIVFILGIGLLTVSNVILRYFNVAMMGYIEVIEVMMIVAALSAMILAVFNKIQVSIDILVVTMPKKLVNWLEIIWAITCFVFWVSIFWATVRWIIGGAFREQTDILHIPIVPFQILWLIGLFFICVFYLRDSIILLRGRLKG